MRTISAFLLVFFLVSCGGWIGDSTENLSGNYKYVFEGAGNAVIYGGKTKQKVIPCSIEAYNYNEDYILAFQKAASHCFFPHEVKQEVGKSYYWIIEIKEDTLYRFSNLEKYTRKRKELGVPETLQLEIK